MVPSERVVFFNSNQLELIKTRVVELLEKRGVKMDHPQIIKLLNKAGAVVDFERKMVRFPRKFFMEQIQKVPDNIILTGKNGSNRLVIPRQDGTFYTRTNMGGQSWIEPVSGKYREIRAADAHL